jgi:hypothetical protein
MSTEDQGIQSLITALSDNRDGLRQFAIRRLVSMGARAIPALLLAIKTENQHVQEGAAIALATMGPVSVPYLMQAMQCEDRKLRWAATWVLSSMPPEIRQMIPKVSLPGVEQVPVGSPKASDSGLHGVWSDSWLTKVRERLESNKQGIVALCQG